MTYENDNNNYLTVDKSCENSHLKPQVRRLDNFYTGTCVFSATLQYSKILVLF